MYLRLFYNSNIYSHHIIYLLLACLFTWVDNEFMGGDCTLILCMYVHCVANVHFVAMVFVASVHGVAMVNQSLLHKICTK